MIDLERSALFSPASDEPAGVASSSIPRWRQIESTLESRIRLGRFSPGERLPTEDELAREFDVHRHTVRRALERLRERGLVRSEQGHGVFVREPALTYRLGRSSRLSEAARWQHRTQRREILTSGPVRADRGAARALGVSTGHLVCKVEALRFIDETPFAVTTYLFPLPRFAGFDNAVRERGSIRAAMEAYGVPELVRTTLSIRAALPAPAVGKLLQVGRHKPLLELDHLNVDPRGKPVQLTRSRINSAWLNVEIQFRD